MNTPRLARPFSLRFFLGFAVLATLSANGAFAQCSSPSLRNGATATFILAGRVVSELDNMDLAFVTLMLEGVDHRQMAVTDMSGRFLFNCLEPGTYTIQARKQGYQTTEAQFSLLTGSSAGNSDATIRMRPLTTTITAPKGPVLSARQAQIPPEAKKLFDTGVEELSQNKRPEACVESFRRAIEIYHDYDEAYVQLGIAYYRLARREEAEQTFRKALQVYPQNARAHIFLGKLLSEQGKLDPAVEELRKATGINDGESLWLAHLDLARILTKQGKAKEAYEHAIRAHELDKKVEDVHVAYYNACVNLRDYSAGLAELDEIVKLYPTSETSRKLQALRPMLAKNVAAKKP